eukprot:gene27069-32708_t
MRHLRSNVACAQICNFLKTHASSKTHALPDIETFIADIASKTNSPTLRKILADFGWSPTQNQFENDDVDLAGLTLALSEKSMRLDTRTFQLGPNLTPKSFLPGLLLSHLCHVANHHGRQGSSSDKLVGEEASHAALHPKSFFFHGTCLLVDISGFTRLSSDFCALGKEGIDGLQQATNGYMGKLVEVIYQHGGDIIKFAGDAIICVFVHRDVKESLQMGYEKGTSTISSRAVNCFPIIDDECGVNVDVCKQAMVCAMMLRDLSTSKLTVHVALSCGKICLGILGGHSDKFECLISGPCLMELSQCLDDTKSKEVAVSAYFAKVVGPDVLTEFGGLKLGSGNWLLRYAPYYMPTLWTESSEVEEAVVDYVIMSSKPEYMRLVNMFVPLPVSLAFESGGLKYLAEIREVTTMFMKWDSYSVDYNSDIITLQTAFVQIQAIIAQQGGFIRQFLVDDKGCVLIACWGVHTASYLDNASRALCSAVRIRDLFISSDAVCSIGLTTGNVYCGNVGSELRREYAAIGDSVNLSARLMSKAKGGILIDESTHARLSVAIWKLFIALEPMQVKGKTMPIQAYSFESTSSIDDVVASSQQSDIEEYEIKLSCRTTLLKLLERQLKRTVTRDRAVGSEMQSMQAGPDMCNVVYLEGRVGSGKATTAKWFAKEAKRRDIRVFRVSHIESQDILMEYKALSKLLVEFIGRDVFVDGNKLRMVIMHVLKAIYGDDSSCSQGTSLPLPNAILHSSPNAPSSVKHYSNPNSTSHQFPVASSKNMTGNEYIDKVALPVLRMVLGNLVSASIPLSAADSTNYTPGDAKFDRSSSYNASSNKRIPIKLVCDTIRDLIAFYLLEEPTVVILENLHYADENSLKVLASLRDIPAPSVLLMTSLSSDDMFADYARAKHCRISISRQDMIHNSGDVTALTSTMKKASADALDYFKATMCQSVRTHYMKIDEFDVSEIEGMIRGVLHVSHVPLGLAQWVQSLSGGSIYWINEMLEFIKVTGIESFMAITSSQHSPERMKTVRRHSSGAQRHSSVHSLRSNDKVSALAFITSGASNSAITVTSGLPSPSSSDQFSTINGPFVLEELRTISVDQDICLQEAKFSQLQHFIISRFERLPLDDQRILKKASVIGFDFSRYTLYGILAPGLKPHLHMALKNLVKEKWIVKVQHSEASRRADARSNGPLSTHDTEYVFAHSMAWDTLYNLIPPGDRKEIHQMVANYYGNMSNTEDAVLYERISFHYSHCDEQKAVEYATKAAVMYLIPPNPSLHDCLGVLMTAVKLAQTVADMKALSYVLEACKGLFNDSYCSSRAESDISVALSQNGASALTRNTPLKEHWVPRQRSTSFFAWFSCARSNAVVPLLNASSVNSSVASSLKERKGDKNAKSTRRMVSKFDLLGQITGADSSRSLVSSVSFMSAQSLNEKGRDYILRILSVLDKNVEKGYAELVMANKAGSLLRWHKDIMRDLRGIDRDISSESQRSRSSSRQDN